MTDTKLVNLRSHLRLNLSPAEMKKFGADKNVVELSAGVQRLPVALLDHWYVKAHLDQAQQPVGLKPVDAGGEPDTRGESPTDDELRALVEKKLGRKPKKSATREELLELLEE